MSEPTVRIWEPYVRVFHWGLVASMVTAWATGDELQSVHEFAGYTAGALIASRLVMGFAGGRYTRFAQFVKSPRAVLAYASALRRGEERRYLGHNPLGAAMVVALLGLVSGIAFTGWLQTTDAYWGIEWVEDLHAALVNIVIGCVVLHVGGVVMESRRQKENLAAAMITGNKRAPEPGDIA